MTIIKLGIFQWQTKAEAKKALNNMFESLVKQGKPKYNKKGEAVPPTYIWLWKDQHPISFQVLLDLYARLPTSVRAPEPENISAFKITKTKKGYWTTAAFDHSNRNFAMFSWTRRLSQSLLKPRSLFIKACRDSVYSQIRDFKESKIQNYELFCNYCGTDVTQCPYDIDHIVTFKSIFNSFMNEIDPDIEQCVVHRRGGFTRFDLRHPYTQIVAAQFAEYHEERSILQILCKTCHRKKPTDLRRNTTSSFGRKSYPRDTARDLKTSCATASNLYSNLQQLDLIVN